MKQTDDSKTHCGKWGQKQKQQPPERLSLTPWCRFNWTKTSNCAVLKAPSWKKGNINQADVVQRTSGSLTILLFPVSWNEKQESKQRVHFHWDRCFPLGKFCYSYISWQSLFLCSLINCRQSSACLMLSGCLLLIARIAYYIYCTFIDNSRDGAESLTSCVVLMTWFQFT